MFMNYNWPSALANFINSLKVMGYGMLCIFIAIAIIYFAVFLLSKLPAEKQDKQ